jgi:Uri superfamily endonuclease
MANKVKEVSKKCTKCFKMLPLTDYYIDKTPLTKVGYLAKCKACCKIYQDNKKKNDIDITITHKICSICNENKLISEYYKSYRHKDGYFKWCGSCHDERVKNKEYNPKIKRTKEYMIAYKKKQEDNPIYQIKHTLRTNLNGRLDNTKKLYRTLEYVGCTLEFFKKWIEYNFDKNMSWDNRKNNWHIDHIMPCASYDLSKQEQIHICYNWTNLRPLDKTENILKASKIDLNLVEIYKEKSKQFLKEIKYEIKDNIYNISTAS